MATTHWRTGHTVADLLRAPDAGWSFHQLVRVMLPPDLPEDELLETIAEKIAFVGSQARDFPPGDIRSVVPAALDGDKAQITCANYNLAGVSGPLPEPFVELLQQDLTYGKGAMAAFIDIFNSRLQSLRYLLRARTDNTLTSSSAEDSMTGKVMLSLSGHLDERNRELHGQSANVLMGLAGLLANCRTSLPVIRQLFQVVLGLDVIEMKSLIGRWLTVAEEDHTLLGRANNRLGSQATLGRKIWDQQAAFGLTLGPMPLDRLEQLQPGGNEHHKLRQLVEWVSDVRCDCRVTLICEQDRASVAKLSHQKNKTNTLGFCSWLSGKQSEQKRVSFMLHTAH